VTKKVVSVFVHFVPLQEGKTMKTKRSSTTSKRVDKLQTGIQSRMNICHGQEDTILESGLPHRKYMTMGYVNTEDHRTGGTVHPVRNC
jgi:hypothetical protein